MLYLWQGGTSFCNMEPFPKSCCNKLDLLLNIHLVQFYRQSWLPTYLTSMLHVIQHLRSLWNGPYSHYVSVIPIDSDRYKEPTFKIHCEWCILSSQSLVLTGPPSSLAGGFRGHSWRGQWHPWNKSLSCRSGIITSRMQPLGSCRQCPLAKTI